MHHRLATLSPHRVWAREVIEKTVADHVHGHLFSLPPEDLHELRRILHQIVGFKHRTKWEKQILREEWRAALGYTNKRKPAVKRVHYIRERDIFPAMRDWARKKGLKIETTAP